MAANIRRMLDIENLDKNSLKWLPISMAAPWMLRIAEKQSAAQCAMAARIVEEEHSLAECFRRKYENSRTSLNACSDAMKMFRKFSQNMNDERWRPAAP